VVRQHKKVIHLSCIILCNGHTINKDCLTPGAGFSDYHKFPLKYPSRAGHLLWTTAIKKISSDFFVLLSSLGKFISRPHRGFRWTTDADGSILHLEMMSDSTTKYLTYYPTHATRTRSGQRFIQGNTFCKSPLPYYASVTWFLDTSVFLHSWLGQFVPEITSTLFWENIRSIDNPSMWRNLQCNGDGTWIYDGLRMGSLIVIHDGSYMKEVSTSISTAAVMILCIVTGLICKCIIAEHSASASSYCGEILGAIITQILLWAAVAGKMGPYPIITEDCYNNGVVLHGNSQFCPLSGTQTQANVLRVMKRLITRQPFIFIIKFLYVASHSNDRKDWASCTIKERLNIKANHLAKQALLHAHSCNEYFDGCFPAEDFWVYTTGCKVTGLTKPSLEMHWGRSEAKRFLDFKHIVHTANFDTIWWHGMDLAMSNFPKMYRIFVSKQVSGWCGTNSKNLSVGLDHLQFMPQLQNGERDVKTHDMLPP
jgi:hypothetical protein